MGELERRLPQTHNVEQSASAEVANLETVEVMRKWAAKRADDPLMRLAAVKILETYGTKSHNYIDEAVAIGGWVKVG